MNFFRFSLPGEVVLQVLTSDESNADTWKEMLEKVGLRVETQGSNSSLVSQDNHFDVIFHIRVRILGQFQGT